MARQKEKCSSNNRLGKAHVFIHWHLFGSACRGGGVCFERIDESDERDDSVLVTEHSIRYHFRNYADRDLFGVWIEVDIDPPHDVIERSPLRENALP